MLLSAFVLFLTGCNNEEEPNFGYENLIDTLFESLDACDNQSFLRCFSPTALKEYENSLEYNEKLCEDIYGDICNQLGEKSVVINSKIKDKTEISPEEFSHQSGVTEKRNKVKKAYRLDVRVLAFGSKNHDESYSASFEILVGKIGANWYVCQSPKLEIKLVKDVKDNAKD